MWSNIGIHRGAREAVVKRQGIRLVRPVMTGVRRSPEDRGIMKLMEKKTQIKKVHTKMLIKEQKPDFTYWQTQPYQSRIAALEEIRKEFHSWRYDVMEIRTLRAHFDGNQILLDEPFELEPDTELLITILPKSSDEEREDWTRLSLESLARAYSDDEPEYSSDLIKEANPEYEGR